MYARTAAPARPRIGLLGIVYIVAGLIVAATHHYFANLHTLKQVLSAVLAVVLCPLLLIGINLHVH